jgi:hypothetical protein
MRRHATVALTVAALGVSGRAEAQIAPAVPAAASADGDAASLLRTLRYLADHERSQRLFAGATYIGAGAIYLGGAGLLYANTALRDEVSRNVVIEMLVAGPVEIAYGAWLMLSAGTYTSLARELERDQRAGVAAELTLRRSLDRWQRAADSDRTWLRVYGVLGIALGAASLGFGVYAFAVEPFNADAAGLNAVLGVTALAAGGLGIGYGIRALAAEPEAADLLRSYRRAAVAPPTLRASRAPSVGLAPQPGGLRLSLSWTWM